MRCRAVILAVFAVIALSGLAASRLNDVAAAAAWQRRRPAQPARRAAGRTARRPDYANFSHRTAEHQKQECGACHKFPSPNWQEARKGDEAFPDVTEYPQHASCLGCHRAQFFARGERPVPRICTVCHVAGTPRNNARHPFPNPRERFDQTAKGRAHVSDFRISFPHDKHAEIVTAAHGRRPDKARSASVSLPDAHPVNVSFVGARWHAQQPAQSQPAAPAQTPENCAACHQTYQPQGESEDEFVTKPPAGLPEDAVWLKKGTFKTTPTSHAGCFQCHAQESGVKPEPTDCAMCHRLPATAAEPPGDFDPKLAAQMGVADKITLEKWRRREAGRFRHEWLSHAELRCDACHNVLAMNTLDERTKRVPVRSCGGAGAGAGCHIDADAGAILNEVVAKKQADPNFRCTKCHVVFGLRPLPASHAEAVAAPPAK